MPNKSGANIQSSPPLRRWGSGARIDDHGQGAARILAAARSCFAESSVTSTTIDHIAQAAGVSRRTVYRYFDNKEAIILAVVEKQAEPFFEEMSESLETLPDKSFRQVLIHCVLFSIENGPRMEGHQLLLGKTNAAATMDFYLGSADMRSRLHSLLEEHFEQARRAGEINREWNLDDLLNWMGRLVYSFIQFPEPLQNVERLVNQFLFPGKAIT